MVLDKNTKEITYLRTEAKVFLNYYYQEHQLNGFDARWRAVEKSILSTGDLSSKSRGTYFWC